MPIYEYRCGTCGDQVEVLVRSSATTPLCPDCGSPLTDKLFSAFNVASERARRPAGHTCCGREERCEAPACAGEGGCRHE
jgi:putative FmdB family regulatory protein